MALLILEQLDLRVDQQWINTAAFARLRIPIGVGYRIFKSTALEYFASNI